MTRPPCIVCGARPHDREYHARYRAEYKATAHLLRRSWPRLRGMFSAAPGPRRGDVRWYAKILTGGQVAHVPVRPGDRGYEEAS